MILIGFAFVALFEKRMPYAEKERRESERKSDAAKCSKVS